jgi:hypothetical protein
MLGVCRLAPHEHRRDMPQSILKYSGAMLSLGSLCDDVLLAIYERKEAPLSTGSLRRIEEAANWFAGLSVLLADPLSLTDSLPHIDKLEVTKYLDSRGSSLDYTIYAIDPAVAAFGNHADTKGVMSKKMAQLLRSLADDELAESEVWALQEALANLSHKLTPPGRMHYN